jgi:lipoprotein signal peptidase
LWLDLWSKWWAFSRLDSEQGFNAIPGFLEFRRSLNDGAVFGSFTGYVSVFIVASLLALAFVFYLFAKSAGRQWGLQIALAMILSGAIGNLYDRAFVQADIVRFPEAKPPRPSMIGKLMAAPSNGVIRIGDWPDAANPRTFKAEDVTLHHQGVVRDFLKFTAKFPASWPRVGGRDVWPWIFNVADAALVCGVAFLMLHCLFDRRPGTASPTRLAGPGTP